MVAATLPGSRSDAHWHSVPPVPSAPRTSEPFCGLSSVSCKAKTPRAPDGLALPATPSRLDRLLAAGVSPSLAYTLAHAGTDSGTGPGPSPLPLTAQLAMLRAEAVAAADAAMAAAAAGALQHYPNRYPPTPGSGRWDRPAPAWSLHCASDATAAAFAPGTPFRHLKLRPNLRVRCLLYPMWRFWAGSTVYARAARPLGLLHRRACHWRGRRRAEAVRRWRSLASARRARVVLFFSHAHFRRRAVRRLAAAWQAWRAAAGRRAVERESAALAQVHAGASPVGGRRALPWRHAAERLASWRRAAVGARAWRWWATAEAARVLARLRHVCAVQAATRAATRAKTSRRALELWRYSTAASGARWGVDSTSRARGVRLRLRRGMRCWRSVVAVWPYPAAVEATRRARLGADLFRALRAAAPTARQSRRRAALQLQPRAPPPPPMRWVAAQHGYRRSCQPSWTCGEVGDYVGKRSVRRRVLMRWLARLTQESTLRALGQQGWLARRRMAMRRLADVALARAGRRLQQDSLRRRAKAAFAPARRRMMLAAVGVWATRAAAAVAVAAAASAAAPRLARAATARRVAASGAARRETAVRLWRARAVSDSKAAERACAALRRVQLHMLQQWRAEATGRAFRSRCGIAWRGTGAAVGRHVLRVLRAQSVAARRLTAEVAAATLRLTQLVGLARWRAARRVRVTRSGWAATASTRATGLRRLNLLRQWRQRVRQGRDDAALIRVGSLWHCGHALGSAWAELARRSAAARGRSAMVAPRLHLALRARLRQAVACWRADAAGSVHTGWVVESFRQTRAPLLTRSFFALWRSLASEPVPFALIAPAPAAIALPAAFRRFRSEHDREALRLSALVVARMRFIALQLRRLRSAARRRAAAAQLEARLVGEWPSVRGRVVTKQAVDLWARSAWRRARRARPQLSSPPMPASPWQHSWPLQAGPARSMPRTTRFASPSGVESIGTSHPTCWSGLDSQDAASPLVALEEELSLSSPHRLRRPTSPLSRLSHHNTSGGSAGSSLLLQHSETRSLPPHGHSPRWQQVSGRLEAWSHMCALAEAHMRQRLMVGTLRSWHLFGTIHAGTEAVAAAGAERWRRAAASSAVAAWRGLSGRRRRGTRHALSGAEAEERPPGHPAERPAHAAECAPASLPAPSAHPPPSPPAHLPPPPAPSLSPPTPVSSPPDHTLPLPAPPPAHLYPTPAPPYSPPIHQPPPHSLPLLQTAPNQPPHLPQPRLDCVSSPLAPLLSPPAYLPSPPTHLPSPPPHVPTPPTHLPSPPTHPPPAMATGGMHSDVPRAGGLHGSAGVRARSALLSWSRKAAVVGRRRHMAASAQLGALTWLMRRAWRRWANIAASLSVRSAVQLWWASQAAAVALGRWCRAMRIAQARAVEAQGNRQRLSSREAAWRRLTNRSAARRAVAWWRAAVTSGIVSAGGRGFPCRSAADGWTDPPARRDAMGLALAWDAWVAWRCGHAELGARAARARQYARAAVLVEALARWRSRATLSQSESSALAPPIRDVPRARSAG